MTLRNIFCPECGKETKVNDERDFCFCVQCGKKIVLRSEQAITGEKAEIETNANIKEHEDVIGKKLEEVSFYYQLSRDKNEDSNFSQEPVYYLKAQDILVDLSQLYPEDYRIWWELCKPIDFYNASSGIDVCGQYKINEDHFNKALDKADLSEKRNLIEEHDRYVAEKKAAMERAEEKRRQEEQKRQQEDIERQKLEQKQQEEARKEQIAKQQEQMQLQQEKIQKGLSLSTSIWQDLFEKKYTEIDNSYFTFPVEKNHIVLGVFKNYSDNLYLMTFLIDGNKKNAIYRNHTLAIKFDESGHGVKLNNSPVYIEGLLPCRSNLFITNNENGGLTVNGQKLHRDTKYVSSIIKNAKKPMIAAKKYFY